MKTQTRAPSGDDAPEPVLLDTEFDLPKTGLTRKQRAAAIEQLREYLDYHQERFLGYQVNQQLQDETCELTPFL
jgi:hypothetical protein